MSRWIFALGLLLAAPALGGDFGVLDGGTCDSTPAKRTMNPGEVFCYDPTASTDDSSILSVLNCESYDLLLFDDKDGDATVCTVAWQLQLCPSAQGSLTAAAEDLACAAAAGVAAMSGDDAEVNLAGIFIRVRGDGIGANAADCRLLVKCAQGSN